MQKRLCLFFHIRYYNPDGSFLALDLHPGDDKTPLSQNGYTDVDNNPVMSIDPDGPGNFSSLKFLKHLSYNLFVFLGCSTISYAEIPLSIADSIHFSTKRLISIRHNPTFQKI